MPGSPAASRSLLKCGCRLLKGRERASATALTSLVVSKETHVVAPRQLCNNLLHNFLVGVGLGEGTHVFEIAGG